VQPRLRFQLPEGEIKPQNYTIRVRTATGDADLASLPVRPVGSNTVEAVWPKGVKLARGQQYQCWGKEHRGVDINSAPNPLGPYSFTVLSEAALSEVERDEKKFAGDPVRLAALYLKNGLYAEAWPLLQTLQEQNLGQINSKTYELAKNAAALPNKQ